ncbi:MAG: glycosyltransferase family 39 protein [Lewinellaceae bacterium]|nr:glycosyltransferase family 39 protein [Lewinellaceae bacterium]
MKSKKKTDAPTPRPANAGSPQKNANARPRGERLTHWLQTNRYKVVAGLAALWIVVRVVYFVSVAHSPLFQLYRWNESDSHFFDQWARTLAAGDWLNREPLHPYHGWHRSMAEHHFKQHPEDLSRLLAANPNRDTSFIPGKALWNEWYGGNRYHQEPLYPYLLAVLYALTGNGVYWMLVLQILVGVLSGFLLWWLARKFFGDTVAVVTGLLYAFCGIILFQELLLLRTSWSVFFALLTLAVFQRARTNPSKLVFLVTGITIGLAFLLQSYFVLFLIGAIAVYAVQERKLSAVFLQNTALLLSGFLVALLPLIARNAAVGAPLFGASSIGAITFAVANVHDTEAVSRWQPDIAQCSGIMGKSNGALVSTVSETLKTHPSAGSYLQLLWAKFQHTVDGAEWPNNENYYFYQETVPFLKWIFLDFYWIAWLGVVGILFALYYKKGNRALFLAILVQLAIILGFYVLGRLRTPLAALLLPFVAYAIVEMVQFIRKDALRKILVAAACFAFFFYPFYRKATKMLDPTDYEVLYDIVYYNRIKGSWEARQWNDAIAAHNEFMRFQPGFVKNIKPGQVLRSAPEVAVLNYFANHHQIHSYLYEDSGNAAMAAREIERHNLLKQIVTNSQQRLLK